MLLELQDVAASLNIALLHRCALTGFSDLLIMTAMYTDIYGRQQ